jgi:hypothetical protein
MAGAFWPNEPKLQKCNKDQIGATVKVTGAVSRPAHPVVSLLFAGTAA